MKENGNKIMRILAILMILTLSSCMVSQKTFDAEQKKSAVLNERIDKLEREVKYKDEIMRSVIDGLIKRMENIKPEIKEEHRDD